MAKPATAKSRPSSLVFAYTDALDKKFARIYPIVVSIIKRLNGRTWRYAMSRALFKGSEWGKAHLRRMLRNRSPDTLMAHARGTMAFLAWLEGHSPAMGCTPKSSEPAELEEWAFILRDHLHDLMDAGVAMTVPKTRLTNLREMAKIASLDIPWPVNDPALDEMAGGYFRDATHTPRPGPSTLWSTCSG